MVGILHRDGLGVETVLTGQFNYRARIVVRHKEIAVECTGDSKQFIMVDG